MAARAVAIFSSRRCSSPSFLQAAWHLPGACSSQTHCFKRHLCLFLCFADSTHGPYEPGSTAGARAALKKSELSPSSQSGNSGITVFRPAGPCRQLPDYVPQPPRVYYQEETMMALRQSLLSSLAVNLRLYRASLDPADHLMSLEGCCLNSLA